MTVHYVGSLVSDGSVFDSSRAKKVPFSFLLGSDGVIRGWNLGVAQMCLNQRSKLTIAAHAAYGEKGCEDKSKASGTGVIPPNADLIFDVELLDINFAVTLSRYRGTLDAWVTSKLTAFDDDAEARTPLEEKHGSRAAYELYLKGVAARKYQAEREKRFSSAGIDASRVPDPLSDIAEALGAVELTGRPNGGQSPGGARRRRCTLTRGLRCSRWSRMTKRRRSSRWMASRRATSTTRLSSSSISATISQQVSAARASTRIRTHERVCVCTNRKSRPRRQTPSLVACPFELVLGRADLFVPPPYPRRRNPTFHLPPHLLLSSTPLLAFTSSSRADLLPSPTNDSTAVCFRSVSLSPLLPQPTYTAPSPPPLRRLRPGPTGSRRSGSAARVCAGAVATLAYRGTPRSAARKGRPPRACVADAAEMGRPTSSPASPKTAGRCRGSRGRSAAHARSARQGGGGAASGQSGRGDGGVVRAAAARCALRRTRGAPRAGVVPHPLWAV